MFVPAFKIDHYVPSLWWRTDSKRQKLGVKSFNKTIARV